MRLIDADAAIDEIRKCRFVVDAIEKISGLPTAQPQTGKWMFSPDDAEGICTVCQYKIYGRPYQGRYLIVPYNFCPNCGARMVKE